MKFSRSVYLFALIIFALFLSACKQEEETETVYYPLGALLDTQGEAGKTETVYPLDVLPDKQGEADELFSYSYSYYSYDSEAGYKDAPAFKENPLTLDLSSTTLLIIDAWDDNASELINAESEALVRESILPLAKAFAARGGRVIVATNAPEYSPTSIDKRLEALVDEGSAELIYHQEYETPEKIQELLNGTDTLIYTGTCSNMCILYRPIGIISLHYNLPRKYRMYIVPDAAIAVINMHEADNRMVQDTMCTMLAQNSIAQIIVLNDLMEYLQSK